MSGNIAHLQQRGRHADIILEAAQVKELVNFAAGKKPARTA